MKKFLSILLALVMTLSLSTVAFADADVGGCIITSVSEGDNTQDIDATTTISGDVFDRAAIEYNVKIDWTVTPGTTAVTGGNVYKWNPNSLKYEKGYDVDDTIRVLGGNDLPEGLTEDDIYTNVEITVTNCSNADVDFTIGYNDKKIDDSNYIVTHEESAGAGLCINRLEENPENLRVHTLRRADLLNSQAEVVTAVEGRTDVYKFNKEKFDEVPIDEDEAATATYKGKIRVWEIYGNNISNGNTITVGTYTVTLMESTGASED